MRHYIILASAYSRGCRIALDIAGENSYSLACGYLWSVLQESWEEAPVSFHSLSADGDSPEDIVKADPYFSNVKFIKDIRDFIHMLQADRVLSCLDVARYFMALQPGIPAEKLEELVIKAFGAYLAEDNSILFVEGYDPDMKEIDSVCRDVCENCAEGDWQIAMALRSRILASKSGEAKLRCIHEALGL